MLTSTASAASPSWCASGARPIGTGADPYLLEACAGIIDPGETPEEAARRETEEEIGVTIGSLRKARQRYCPPPAR